ncbi:MAG TPA: hypothetical protein VJS11_09875 [Acidobacteriaceae bacterium]|nr:hypothetical protein [Acidobacteriaceae bacterium]
MRYSAFEQAAAEATLGVREMESQMEQLKNQLEQLKGKRDLLETLSRQLLTLRPTSGELTAEMTPPAKAEVPAPEPAPAPSSFSAPENESEMATAGVYSPPRPLRDGWFSRNSDSGTRPAASDSGLRGRL